MAARVDLLRGAQVLHESDHEARVQCGAAFFVVGRYRIVASEDAFLAAALARREHDERRHRAILSDLPNAKTRQRVEVRGFAKRAGLHQARSGVFEDRHQLTE
jgi:hypothetical protein